MSNTQLYLSIGLPMLTILVALLVQLVAIFGSRSSVENQIAASIQAVEKQIAVSIQSLEKQIAASNESLGKRMDSFDDRMGRLERSLDDMRTTFVKNHTERLARLEERVFPAAS